MQIDVARWLTHRVELQADRGPDTAGSPTYGEWVADHWVEGQWIELGLTITCFIEPVTRRLLTGTGRIIRTDYDVLVLGDVAIKAGDRLRHGLDQDATEILPAAIVEMVDDSYHPVDDRKLRLCHTRTVVL